MITFLWRKFGNVSADDKDRTIEYTEAWEADSVIDYLKHASIIKKKGTLIYLAGVGYFWIDAAKISRLGEPKPNGRIQYTYDYTFRFPKPEDCGKQGVPPWGYPPTDITYEKATEEIAVEQIYPPNSLVPVRFCNSAGIMMEAAGTKGLMQLSFSYALKSFDQNLVWGFVEKINAYPIKIVNMNFPARTVRCDAISATEKIDYTDEKEIKWQYWEIKIQLLINPDTWNKQYLNVGCHVWTSGGLQQLWHWIDENGQTHFAPYSDFLTWANNDEQKENRGEAVTEPMFLNAAGTAISGFNGYQQIPTYKQGSQYYPADFSFLNLPQTRGWRL